MCGIVPKDRSLDAQFIGGEDEPRVVAPLRLCDNTSKYGSYNRRSALISTRAIGPASHDTAKFSSTQSLILVSIHDSIKDPLICIGNFCHRNGLRADDGSPVFDRLGKQIGRECAGKQLYQCCKKIRLLLFIETKKRIVDHFRTAEAR